MAEENRITIETADRSVTMEQFEAVAQAAGREAQLPLPFPLDRKKLKTFLLQWCAIEDEQERLRKEAAELKADYGDDLPIRALLTAVKIVRAKRKLETHPKEPMPREQLAQFEAVVEQHLVERQREHEALANAAAEASVTPLPSLAEKS